MEWWHNQFPSPLEPVMITATRACYNVQNKIKLYKFNFFLSESLWNTTYTYCFQFYFQENKKMVFLMCEVLHPLQLNDTIIVWDRLFVIYPPKYFFCTCIFWKHLHVLNIYMQLTMASRVSVEWVPSINILLLLPNFQY